MSANDANYSFEVPQDGLTSSSLTAQEQANLKNTLVIAIVLSVILGILFGILLTTITYRIIFFVNTKKLEYEKIEIN